MASYATPRLEFSTDPLSVSNASATWKNVTQYCISAQWASGVSRELDDPQAGSATFVLKNSQRRFEPDYAAGAYYPNIVPGRRFRWSLIADGVTYQQGIWYATSWEVQYPDKANPYSEVVVSCVDGFWRLALDTLGTLSPPEAQTYADVITADNPTAYFPLAESAGGALEAAVGNSGSYKGVMEHIHPNPVLGDSNYAAQSPANSGVYARSKMEDVNVFNDSQAFTVEAVATLGGSAAIFLATGPWNTADASGIFVLSASAGSSGTLIKGASGGTQSFTGSTPSTGTHHYALTWNGSTAIFYIDGAVLDTISAGSMRTPDANDYLYIMGQGHGAAGAGTTFSASHVAFYDYVLTPAQIASHSNSALTKGYAAASSGSRIATLATDPLWSTAGIPTGTITAAARFQAGQTSLDEITQTAKIEQPGSLFYFDDAGNPDYRGLMDTQTSSATFGELEVQYDSIQLVYNDELFNSSTVAGEGLDGATATNATSISDYGVRAQDATGLIITNDADARLLSQSIVDVFSTPRFRVDSISLNGAAQNARTQILSREVGDTIRIKRRGEGGTAIDIITRILAKEKSYDVNGDLRCSWTLARGFNASVSGWRVGVTGFSEVGQTTVAG